MQLTSFQCERFRNILDTGEIPVDKSITCLVGKNESGKTNLLHALHSLNPAGSNRSFDDHQYPRWLEKGHKRSGDFQKAKPILATFRLDESERADVAETFGESVLIPPEWLCYRKYDGKQYVDAQIDEKAACDAITRRFAIGPIEATTIRDLRTKLAALTSQPAGSVEDGNPTSTDLTAPIEHIDRLYPEQDVLAAVHRKLCSAMPRFFYFDDYNQLLGRTPIDPVIEALRTGNRASLTASQSTALSLLQIAFATDQLIDQDYEKATGEMEAVAADLTQQVRRYWHQNDHLRLLQLRVLDDRHFFTNCSP